ncbi:uncharacterized protein LOC144289018 isoform X3 [Canis aureus]
MLPIRNIHTELLGKDRIKMNIKTLLKKKKTLLFWAVETIESKPILDNICLAGRNMQNIHSFSNGSSPEEELIFQFSPYDSQKKEYEDFCL